MFRRKKSNISRSSQDPISVSAPQALTRPAAPLFEKFARSTHTTHSLYAERNTSTPVVSDLSSFTNSPSPKRSGTSNAKSLVSSHPDGPLPPRPDKQPPPPSSFSSHPPLTTHQKRRSVDSLVSTAPTTTPDRRSRLVRVNADKPLPTPIPAIISPPPHSSQHNSVYNSVPARRLSVQMDARPLPAPVPSSAPNTSRSLPVNVSKSSPQSNVPPRDNSHLLSPSDQVQSSKVAARAHPKVVKSDPYADRAGSIPSSLPTPSGMVSPPASAPSPQKVQRHSSLQSSSTKSPNNRHSEFPIQLPHKEQKPKEIPYLDSRGDSFLPPQSISTQSMPQTSVPPLLTPKLQSITTDHPRTSLEPSALPELSKYAKDQPDSPSSVSPAINHKLPHSIKSGYSNPLPLQAREETESALRPMSNEVSKLRVADSGSPFEKSFIERPHRKEHPTDPGAQRSNLALNTSSLGTTSTSFVLLPPEKPRIINSISESCTRGSGSGSSIVSHVDSTFSFDPTLRDRNLDKPGVIDTPLTSHDDLMPLKQDDAAPIKTQSNIDERLVESVELRFAGEQVSGKVAIDALDTTRTLTKPISLKKVSYSPMPARRKPDMKLDKHGRLLPLLVVPPPATEPEQPSFYPLISHLSSLPLFVALLPHLTFKCFLTLSSVTKETRYILYDNREFAEEILERFLGGLGYWRWQRIYGINPPEAPDPLELNVKDLNAYMRGVCIPDHEYGRLADVILKSQEEGERNSGRVKMLTKATRAYNRVIFRLRAQADAEMEYLLSRTPDSEFTSPNGRTRAAPSSYPTSSSRSPSRPASRAGSVTSSLDHTSAFGRPSLHSRSTPPQLRPKFRSPLYRPNHAPLLKVFVLSPEGPWLADATILECEKELRRSCAGAKGRLSKSLLKVGDIVWNIAVGDEANLGRSVWDGNYLIDLEYTYSRVGAIPKYLHSLSFPPSYFHKVLRSGTGSDADPIVQIDIGPFGDQIAANLQLLQERVAMDTPQGGRHTVLRWTHRSKFRIPDLRRSTTTLAIPIPGAEGMFVHPTWAGTVVIETEGTNEGLAELQSRCGGAFPQFKVSRNVTSNGRVFRLLRERSKPAEIWLRLIREKDKIL